MAANAVKKMTVDDGKKSREKVGSWSTAAHALKKIPRCLQKNELIVRRAEQMRCCFTKVLLNRFSKPDASRKKNFCSACTFKKFDRVEKVLLCHTQSSVYTVPCHNMVKILGRIVKGVHSQSKMCLLSLWFIDCKLIGYLHVCVYVYICIYVCVQQKLY